MQNFCLSEAIVERFQRVENELGFSEHVIKIDCNILGGWDFKYRSPFEMGSIEELAKSIIHKGQCQPIVIVKASNQFKSKDNLMAEYIVIVGRRRWLACKSKNIKVEAIIKEISFEQAIGLAIADNEKELISDYSKGIFFSSLLNKNMTELKLSKCLNIKLSDLNNYLAFAKVPSDLWSEIEDLSQISATSASMILDLLNKGSIYKEALIANSKHIANGYSAKRIESAVQRYIDKNMKRTSKNNTLQHQIKFDGKIIINLKQGRIQLDKSLVNHGNYEELITKLEKDVIEFANVYLKP